MLSGLTIIAAVISVPLSALGLLSEARLAAPTPEPLLTIRTNGIEFSAVVLGRYYNTSDPQQFIELRPDGLAFSSVGGGLMAYTLDGGDLVISTAIAGAARGSFVPGQQVTFSPRSGTIQQALGGTWVKR